WRPTVDRTAGSGDPRRTSSSFLATLPSPLPLHRPLFSRPTPHAPRSPWAEMSRIEGLLQPFDDEAKTDIDLGFVTEPAFRVAVLEPIGTIIIEAATTQFHHFQ